MEGTCKVCGRLFTWRAKTKDGKVKNETPPETCGELYCVAMTTWTDDEWAGRARMASARRDAGMVSRGGVLDPDYTPPYSRQDGLTWVRILELDDEPLDKLDVEALRRAEA